MPKMIFVNLPVRDLPVSTRFYEAIGFEKNPAFSNDKASCMVWSETIYVMLLTHEFYATFTSLPIADPKTASAALYALARDSREDVDAIVAAAAGAGGQGDVRETQDMGFMYCRTFADPDGHVFEPMWMDPAGIPAAKE